MNGWWAVAWLLLAVTAGALLGGWATLWAGWRAYRRHTPPEPYAPPTVPPTGTVRVHRRPRGGA